jgi:hypothetical protein
VELFYEDSPATAIRATVARLLTDRDEGMGTEVEDYVACWAEITVDEPGDGNATQVVFLGTDFQCRLNGGASRQSIGGGKEISRDLPSTLSLPVSGESRGIFARNCHIDMERT